MTALLAHGLTCGYSGMPVVRDLDLEVDAGQVVALLGRNGAGKSTTLLTLVNLLPPIAGSVRVLDQPPNLPLHRRVRRGLAFVPEQRALVPSLTVTENLRLGRTEAKRVYGLFPELEPLASRRAGLLSGGEQQMLVLGRALATRPRLLLVDELSLGLAPMIVQRLFSAITAAAKDGTGVLLVEQHARLALQYCDHAYVLNRGRIELSGDAATLQRQLDRLEASYLSTLPPSPS